MSQVVHVVPALFAWENVYGGAERFALELARAMAKRTPTRLVAFGSRSARLQLDNLEVRVVRNLLPYRRFRFDPVAPGLVPWLLDADVVHVHQPETMMGSLALVTAKVLGRTAVSSHLGGSGFGLHHFGSVDNWFDAHLHLSQFSRMHFGHSDRKDSEVLLAGIDTHFFSPPPACDEPRSDVVFVGRLLPHKGINYLIEAIDAETPLTIVGRRWRHAARFDQLLEKLAQGKQVKFLEGEPPSGRAWDPDAENGVLRDACRKALCIVLPSVHETVFGEHYAIPELLGLVLLEGMACGAPAIATNLCSLPEIVEDGVTGFLVPPNDADALREKIRWLKEHPEDAARMGNAARARVLERFTWDRVVERCFSSYRGARRTFSVGNA